MTSLRRPTGGGGSSSSTSSVRVGVGAIPNVLLLVSTFLLLIIGTADAHGYLMSPRSRNFLAHSSQDGKGYGGTENDPKVDYEVSHATFSSTTSFSSHRFIHK